MLAYGKTRFRPGGDLISDPATNPQCAESSHQPANAFVLSTASELRIELATELSA